MGTKTIEVAILAPEITQYFDKHLLDTDMWRYGYSLMKKYQAKAERKYKADGSKIKQFNKLYKLYGELHGWSKAIQSYRRGETKEAPQRSAILDAGFDQYKGIMRNDLDAYYKHTLKLLGYNEVPKVQRDKAIEDECVKEWEPE